MAGGHRNLRLGDNHGASLFLVFGLSVRGLTAKLVES
jgi:hypothetical protein